MKLKIILIFTFLLIFRIIGVSQSTVNLHRVYIPAWIGTGYGYEYSIADEITINAGFDFRAYIGDDDFAIDNFVFSPRIIIEPRYYYNLKERANQGKNINSNSANYYSLEMSFEFDYGYRGIRDFPQQTIRILPNMGVRRELSEHFTLDYSIYLGCKFKKYGDRDWDNKPWTSWKPAFGFNFIFSHIF